MPRRPTDRMMTVLTALCALGLAIASVACEGGPQKADAGDNRSYTQLYEAREYGRAYTMASKAAESGTPGERERAMLVAGLAADRMDRHAEAERRLEPLLKSEDPRVAGTAAATLGLNAQSKGQHNQAADLLSQAANKLSGDDKANAAMYAGDSLLALSRTADAKASYTTAASVVKDSALRSEISNRLANLKLPAQAPVIGGGSGTYTIQLGSYAEFSRANTQAARARPGVVSAGLPNPRIVQTSKAGKVMYAVRVGRFNTRDDAERARQRLGKDGLVMAALGE